MQSKAKGCYVTGVDREDQIKNYGTCQFRFDEFEGVAKSMPRRFTTLVPPTANCVVVEHTLLASRLLMAQERTYDCHAPG